MKPLPFLSTLSDLPRNLRGRYTELSSKFTIEQTMLELPFSTLPSGRGVKEINASICAPRGIIVSRDAEKKERERERSFNISFNIIVKIRIFIHSHLYFCLNKNIVR